MKVLDSYAVPVFVFNSEDKAEDPAAAVLLQKSGGFVVAPLDSSRLGEMLEQFGQAMVDRLTHMKTPAAICVCEHMADCLGTPYVEAVIQHEVGHVVAGHLSEIESATLNTDGMLVVDAYEIEADAYAGSIVSNRVVRRAIKKIALLLAEGNRTKFREALATPGVVARLAALA